MACRLSVGFTVGRISAVGDVCERAGFGFDTALGITSPWSEANFPIAHNFGGLTSSQTSQP